MADRVKLSFNSKKITNIYALRIQTGLNQNEFWGRYFVTQSAGSRYENGRRMPKPLTALIRLDYPKEL